MGCDRKAFTLLSSELMVSTCKRDIDHAHELSSGEFRFRLTSNHI